MRKVSRRWKLIVFAGVPLVALTLFVWVIGGRVYITTTGGLCDKRSIIQALRKRLDQRGGHDVNIAGYDRDTSALTVGGVGVFCSIYGDNGDDSFVSYTLIYYPLPHILSYGPDDKSPHIVYGVTRAAIERNADTNGTLKDFE